MFQPLSPPSYTLEFSATLALSVQQCGRASQFVGRVKMCWNAGRSRIMQDVCPPSSRHRKAEVQTCFTTPASDSQRGTETCTLAPWCWKQQDKSQVSVVSACVTVLLSIYVNPKSFISVEIPEEPSFFFFFSSWDFKLWAISGAWSNLLRRYLMWGSDRRLPWKLKSL